MDLIVGFDESDGCPGVGGVRYMHLGSNGTAGSLMALVSLFLRMISACRVVRRVVCHCLTTEGLLVTGISSCQG
jgi:hypothetical protein